MLQRDDVVEIQGRSVGIRQSGNASLPTIIFLNGRGQSLNVWSGVMQCLESTANCIALDLFRGTRSEPGVGSGDSDLASHAQDCTALDEAMQRLSLKGVLTLLMDGDAQRFGLWWYLRNPHRIRALIYTEPLLSCFRLVSQSARRQRGFQESLDEGQGGDFSRILTDQIKTKQLSTPKLLIARKNSPPHIGDYATRGEARVLIASEQPIPEHSPKKFGAAVSAFLECLL